MAQPRTHSLPARLVARGVEGEKPAWLRVTEGEGRWGSAASMAAAIILQLALPNRYALHPRYIVPALELVMLVVLIVMHPSRLSRRSPLVRVLSLCLLAVVALTLVASLLRLVSDVTTGHGQHPVELLSGGAEIWLTNILVFALVYWEYDRGGPADRAAAVVEQPDLLFPQMTDEHLAKDWEPAFFDYFFVSFTCSSAYSPTDTMPLSRWCKALFILQSLLSLLTVTLIAARAVNILPAT